MSNLDGYMKWLQKHADIGCLFEHLAWAPITAEEFENDEEQFDRLVTAGLLIWDDNLHNYRTTAEGIAALVAYAESGSIQALETVEDEDEDDDHTVTLQMTEEEAEALATATLAVDWSEGKGPLLRAVHEALVEVDVDPFNATSTGSVVVR